MYLLNLQYRLQGIAHSSLISVTKSQMEQWQKRIQVSSHGTPCLDIGNVKSHIETAAQIAPTERARPWLVLSVTTLTLLAISLTLILA